jgi:predicted phage terminase large subunit-like protein
MEELLRVRNKVNNDKTKSIENAFKTLLKDKTQYSPTVKDLDKELIRLKTMCLLVEAMYVENDFKASSLAYSYTLPQIIEFLKYVLHFRYKVNGKTYNVYSESQKKIINGWVKSNSDITKIIDVQDGSERLASNFEFLYYYLKEKQMAIAGRYYIHWNIHYLERNNQKKSYPTRENVLQSAVWWFNQGLLKKFGLSMPDTQNGKYDFTPKKIIFSTMPSSGKSFLCNTLNEMFSELAMILEKRGGVLRVGNKDENILRQSRQTTNLILNKSIFDIYPEMKEYISPTGVYNPFSKGSEGEWGLKGCEFEPNTSIFTTRDSALNSIRCQLGIFDDPSRGQQESSNIAIHTKIVNLFNGDFMDRFENEAEMFIILTGTMFNPFDVFSAEIQKALKDGFIRDERFLNTYISADRETIVIVNDCENEYGESAFPEFISTKALKNKRDSMTAYDYACTWRQKPIPAEGLIFSKEFLKFYDEMPPESELGQFAYATIDPTRRRASDFFSMPIFRHHKPTNKYYLIDIIYEKKSVKDLYDKIIKKILQNSIIRCYYEENIDTSLGVALKEKLEKTKSGAEKWCNLQHIYSTGNKQGRIADMADTIINNIVFPSEKYANTKTPMGFAVYQLTQYNGEDTKQHDDFPDSLAMFASEEIINKHRKNTIKTYKKLPI